MPAPASPSISASRPWQNLNTPQTLWAAFYAICALDLLLLCAAIVGAQVHRDAMQTIGKDSAPSMIHAQHIKSALADMDANAANELLGEPGKMPEALTAYEKRRREAATALIDAAKNITYDDEKPPIEAIQFAMGTYEQTVQRARDLHEGSHPEYVDLYRKAARVMDSDILPQADELDRVNRQALDNAYTKQSTKSVIAIVFILLMGAAVLAALIAIQKFLSNKTRRILNPMLVLTTLVTLGFVLYTYSVLAAERHDLKVAKEDAFESIHALWRTRAVAYAANADESRFLLDQVHEAEHEDNFHKKAASIATLPAGISLDSITASIAGLKGSLAEELNNITFAGEREAAVWTLIRFADYVNTDDKIRRLQRSGQHKEAVGLCIGVKPGESNFVFDEFDEALEKTLKINQDAFDAAVYRGFDALKYFEVKASIVAVMIAVLAFMGLIKRIQEYR